MGLDVTGLMEEYIEAYKVCYILKKGDFCDYSHTKTKIDDVQS